MMLRRFHIPRDEGFSLAELMVALIVGFVLLSIIYYVFEASLGNYDRIEAHTNASRAGATAADITSRYIREASRIDAADVDSIDITGDFDGDGVSEALRFITESSENGYNFSIVRAATWLGLDDAEKVVLAERIRNGGSSGEPIFSYSYFDESHNRIVTTDPDDMLASDMITIRFVVDYDLDDSIDAHVATEEVFLRNDPS